MHKNTKPGESEHKPGTPTSENQGEGDKQSAERFNREEQRFVNSDRGQKVIDKAGQVDPSEKQALQDAERLGLARTKGDDPAVTRKQ